MGRHHRSARAAKHLQQLQSVLPVECSVCGQRLGLHRFGNDQCPNLKWKPGNGQDQWANTTFREAGELEAAWPAN